MDNFTPAIWRLEETRIVADGGKAPVALVSSANLLEGPPSPVRPAGPAERIQVFRSGWMWSDLASSSWLPRHRLTFERSAVAVAKAAGALGVRCVLYPQALDVISDLPSLLHFLQTSGGKHWSLLVDPTGMLTAEMIPSAEEHLARLMDGLLNLEQTWAIVLRDTTATPTGLHPAPLSNTGLVTQPLLAAWKRAARAKDLPIVLLAGDADLQRALLTSG